MSIPNSLKEACVQLWKNICSVSKHRDSLSFHDGMSVRNDWDLWNKDSVLVKEFKEITGLFGHADDVSGAIHRGAKALQSGEDYLNAIIEYGEMCKKHWIEFSTDPVTGEKIGKSPTSFKVKMVDGKIEYSDFQYSD